MDGGGGSLVGGEENADGLGIERCRCRIRSEVGEVPAGFLEVLIAGGAFLAIPALLVDQHDGGQQARRSTAKAMPGQIGDGAVAVLEIEILLPVLGALGADFSEGLT